MFKFVEKKKIWFSISLIIIIIGMGFTIFRGLNFGIDFKGGSSIVLQCKKDFDKAEADKVVRKYASDAVTNTVNKSQYQIKSSELTTKKFGKLLKELKKDYKIKSVVSQDEVGASVGKDLKKSAIESLAIAFVAMLLYIAFRFEFAFGISAVIALIHDILITISIYAIFNLPINSPFIAAILTIVGYSINDTIVVFDRIRENTKGTRIEKLDDTVNKSINQTLTRSINTSMTTLFTIIAVLILVPSVRTFSLPITIGIISGTYSSIFIASPLYCLFKKKKKKDNKKVVTA